MQIFLENKKHLEFKDEGWLEEIFVERSQSNEIIRVRNSLFEVNLTSPDGDQDQLKKLKKKLLQREGSYNRDYEDSEDEFHHNLSWDISFEIGFYNLTTNAAKKKCFIRVEDESPNGILASLREVFRRGEVKLSVHVENFKDMSQENNTVQHLLNINEKDVTRVGMEIYDLDVHSHSSMNQWTTVNDKYRWTADITIIAVVPDVFTAVGEFMRDNFLVNKKILLEQLCADASIVAQNGVGVKCHKVFLSVHSSVLATMFQTAMQESQTCTVKMPGMSEASVRAFLTFLYCGETDKAENCCLICFELLAAGQKYDISKMENCMKEILLFKNSEWFAVDVAMKLFFLSKNLKNGENLKKKAINVLKSRCGQLKESHDFRKLFKDEPDAAMDLCIQAMS